MFPRSVSSVASLSGARAFSSSPRSAMARVTLLGRLGAVPQVQKDKQGREILIYAVATTEKGGPAGPDGTRPEPTTTWHRVLQYGATEAAKGYLSSLPAGTVVHIESDFKRRTTKDDAGNYNEQVLLLLRNLEVVSKPKAAEGSESSSESA